MKKYIYLSIILQSIVWHAMAQQQPSILDDTIKRKVRPGFDKEIRRFEETLQNAPQNLNIPILPHSRSQQEKDSLYLDNKRALYAELYRCYDQQMPLSYLIAPELQTGRDAGKAFPYVFSGRPVVIFNVVRPTVLPRKLKPDMGLFFAPEIRMFTTDSKPVRTPSYHVGGYMRVYVGNSVTKKHFPFLELNVVHHSNGQDAPEFLDPEKKVVNLYNGNFSTNYIELFFGKRTTLANGTYIFYKAGINIQNSFPGGLSDEMWNNYGFYRARFSFWHARPGTLDARVKFASGSVVNTKYHFERIRVGGDVTLIAGRMDYAGNDMSRRINAEVYLRYGVYAAKIHPMLMVGYYGQDPYNVYYEKSYFYARLGITANLNSIKLTGENGW